MEMHYLVKGDTGSQLKVTLKRNDTGDIVNCTNDIPRLHFRKKHTSNVLFTIDAVQNDSLLQQGIAIFVFSTNLSSIEPGYYEAEIEVTFDDGSVETVFEKIPFTVRDQIG